jgi:glutathione S-transferase
MAEILAADAVCFDAPVAYPVRNYGPDVGEAGQTWGDLILATPAMQQWGAELPAKAGVK